MGYEFLCVYEMEKCGVHQLWGHQAQMDACCGLGHMSLDDRENKKEASGFQLLSVKRDTQPIWIEQTQG